MLDDQRERLLADRSADYAAPVMYDIAIDDYRLVTQADVDRLLAVAGAYGHVAEVVKRHSAKVKVEPAANLTPDF